MKTFMVAENLPLPQNSSIFPGYLALETVSYILQSLDWIIMKNGILNIFF